MNEDFVSFDLAKKLKEKGLEQSPIYFNYSSYYEWDGLRKIHTLCNASVWFAPHISKDNIYFAPTISQVLKWLREEKKIHICIGICIAPTFSWDYEIVNLDDDCYIHAECGYDSYEDAASNGISYILDNLI